MKKIVENIKFIFNYVIASEKRLIVHNIINIFFEILEMIIGLYIAKWVFDGTQLVGESNMIFILCIVFSILFVFSMYRMMVGRFVQPISSYNIQKEIIRDVIKEIVHVPKLKTDDTEYYNKLARVIGDAKTRPEAVLSSIIYLIKSILQGIILLAATIYIDVQISLLILGSSVFAAVLSIYINKISYKQYMQQTILERKSDYISRVIYLPQFCTDLKRYTGLLDILLKHFNESITELKFVSKKYAKKIAVIESISILGSLLMTNLIPWIIIVRRMSQSALTNGSVVLLLSATSILPGVFSGILNSLVEFSQHSLYINNIREIISDVLYGQNNNVDELKYINSLEFKNISFAYIAHQKNVFSNVNFTIYKGDKIGVIGENGSGKTTLGYLLSGLYNPNEGQILVNGKDYLNISRRDLNDKIVCVNQQFNIYSYSVIENIFMRNVEIND